MHLNPPLITPEYFIGNNYKRCKMKAEKFFTEIIPQETFLTASYTTRHRFPPVCNIYFFHQRDICPQVIFCINPCHENGL